MNRATEPNFRLIMIRENLKDIPDFSPPVDFALRWYRPGDEAHWLRIHLLADHGNRFTTDTFAKQFGLDASILTQCQCYLLDPGQIVIGTGTAWFKDDFEGERIGRVHWVAIVPEFQGRGLSKPLMTAICRRLRELGHRRVYVTTSAARRPAIQLYRRFGFVPLIRNEADRAAWSRIQLSFSEPRASVRPERDRDDEPM